MSLRYHSQCSLKYQFFKKMSSRHKIRMTIGLTFWGRTGTLSKFMLMPGMITVILRGPLKPRTLVSCQTANTVWLFHSLLWISVHLSFTHIADGSQFLSRGALFQQLPGVLGRIGAVVVHCELGAHEVGPDRNTRWWWNADTISRLPTVPTAFSISESCWVAKRRSSCSPESWI